MSRPLERFYEIIAWIFIILVVCTMLTACNRKTPVENAFDNVGQAVIDVQASLPKECQTEIVLAKINDVESKRQVAQSLCAEKIKEAQNKYERTLFALIGLIFLLFLRFFIKK